MTMLFCDSFDHYTTGYLAAKGWTGAGSTSIDTASGRSGGGALKIPSTATASSATRSLKDTTTGIIGFACYLSAYPTTLSKLLVLSASGAEQCTLYIDMNGILEMKCGETSFGIAADAVPEGRFFYLEVRLTVDSASGAFEVRVNGKSSLSGSSLNTQQTANAFINEIIFEANTDTGWYYLIDDLYLNDTLPSTYGDGFELASVNVDFLGDVRIEALYPDADGTYAQFTPSEGASHYALLDKPLLGDEDYTTSLSTTGPEFEQVSYPEPADSDYILKIYAIQPVAAVKCQAMAPVSVTLVTYDIGVEGWLVSQWMANHTVTVGPSMAMLHGVLNFNPTMGDYWEPLWIGYFEFGIKNNGTA